MRETWEKGVSMGRERFTPEQIIGKLHEAEVVLGQSRNIGEAIRNTGGVVPSRL
jgi:hypothetical protein